MRTSNGYGVTCRSVARKVIVLSLDWKLEMATVPLQALIFMSFQGNKIITPHLFNEGAAFRGSPALFLQTGEFPKLNR